MTHLCSNSGFTSCKTLATFTDFILDSVSTYIESKINEVPARPWEMPNKWLYVFMFTNRTKVIIFFNSSKRSKY